MTAEVSTEVQATAVTGESLITVTPLALEKIKEHFEKNADQLAGLDLRVLIRPGGCAGFKKELLPDLRNEETDYYQNIDGVGVVADVLTRDFIDGLVIDYSADLTDAGFKIDNPNWTGGCACGNSFC